MQRLGREMGATLTSTILSCEGEDYTVECLSAARSGAPASLSGPVPRSTFNTDR